MPSIASSKVSMTTILSQRKAGPCNRKEQTAIYDRFQPWAGPSNNLYLECNAYDASFMVSAAGIAFFKLRKLRNSGIPLVCGEMDLFASRPLSCS